MYTPPSVPHDVFEAFLESLSDEPSVEPKVVERLRSALTSGGKIDADVLRRALFDEEVLP